MIALNAAAIYVGVSLSGALGAVVLHVLDPGFLGPVGAVLILAGLVAAELANRLIVGRNPTPVVSGAAPESSQRT
ncbi:hypothetical protein [Pseudaminobacter salicylatoxidans]|uniref:hypothetical protein n=1 Tax=Pseudaminobacter salicylatoxidans TaxID=93369 RepID=UPI0002D46A20|nr:hypothetical protein [Pseudaminobacter salicylatoxidans]